MAQAAQRALLDPSKLTTMLDQPGIGDMVATGSPVRWSGAHPPPTVAPRLGADTEAVLSQRLGLTHAEIARLVDDGVVRMQAEPA